MIAPRPGSNIWRRVDDGYTAVAETSIGPMTDSGHADDVWSVLAQGTWIFPCDESGIEFEVEIVLSHPVGQGGIVVVSPERPTFGSWERLDSWRP